MAKIKSHNLVFSASFEESDCQLASRDNLPAKETRVTFVLGTRPRWTVLLFIWQNKKAPRFKLGFSIPQISDRIFKLKLEKAKPGNHENDRQVNRLSWKCINKKKSGQWNEGFSLTSPNFVAKRVPWWGGVNVSRHLQKHFHLGTELNLKTQSTSCSSGYKKITFYTIREIDFPTLSERVVHLLIYSACITDRRQVTPSILWSRNGFALCYWQIMN